MITNEEIREIIEKVELSDIEQLDVIRRYIYDKKNIDVGKINRPGDIVQLQLMGIAYNSALEYYFKELK